jgi:S-adenosylmethionine synthetase
MNNIHIDSMLRAAFADRHAVEIVERKGLGHPDTLCDALAEELSRGLCRFYLGRFGTVLHHNVDKVLLWGGVARPELGGGRIVEPIEIFLAGRATLEHEGIRVPVEAIAHEVCERWLSDHLHELDPRRHVKIHALIRPGSADLVELFLRQRRTGVWLANDTSCGVGYAPLSVLERSVLSAESALVSRATTAVHPALGEDVKVMGIRRGKRLDFTVACALVGRHLHSVDDYIEAKRTVEQLVRRAVASDGLGDVVVNTADDPSAGNLYLTVVGTSAEAGDDGQAGRGNRANGLITPCRTMTMESVAGKNPMTHVGKLYNVAAGRIAAALVEGVAGIAAAQCALVSQIGAPVTKPHIVDIRIGTIDDEPVEPLRGRIAEIARAELDGIAGLWQEIVDGEVRLY